MGGRITGCLEYTQENVPLLSYPVSQGPFFSVPCPCGDEAINSRPEKGVKPNELSFRQAISLAVLSAAAGLFLLWLSLSIWPSTSYTGIAGVVFWSQLAIWPLVVVCYCCCAYRIRSVDANNSVSAGTPPANENQSAGNKKAR
jgi:hypothetical protein